MKRNRNGVMRDFMGLGRSNGGGESEGISSGVAAFLSSDTPPPPPLTTRVGQIGDQASSKTFSSFPNPSIFPQAAGGFTRRGEGGGGGGGGGGFTGFSGGIMHKKTRPQFTSAMLAGGKKDQVVVADDRVMGALPSASSSAAAATAGSEGGERAAHASKPLEELAASDIQQLSREDCWRLILELGMQWPSSNKTLKLQSQMMDKASTRNLLEQGAPMTVESNSQGNFEATQVHQFENNTSRMLASRALEELARTPSQSGSIPFFVPSPHATTSSTTGIGNLTPSTAAVVKQPSVPITASPAQNQQRVFASNMSGKRTAQLTMFYAGTVNVFDNVTQEKAHLIMLLAANGESLTSALSKFICSQGDSMCPPSKTNADAKPPVQTTPAFSPPASIPSTSAAAPDVIPVVTSAEAQQQHSSFSSLPILVSIRDSLTFAPNSASVPPAQQDQSISQGTHQSQQQQAATLPDLSPTTANAKVEQSTKVISLANLRSMRGESNSGVSAIQRNESQPPERPDASNSSSMPTTTTGLNAVHGSTVCYTQELPHARKTSLARFFDLRQRQKRARSTTSQNLSKISADGSPLTPTALAAMSLPRTEDTTVASIKTSQPSSSRSMSPQPVEGKDAAAATTGKAVEKSPEESGSKPAANVEEAASLPMETDTVVAAVVSS